MPSSSPLVSIIIPTYNRGHLIGQTLDSIVRQTYPNWECIIVDDGSSDDTRNVVKTYVEKDLRFQYHDRPHAYLPGGNGARNFGFSIAKGLYVNWFDDDDLMHDNKLLEQVNLLQKSKKDFCVCQTLVFRDSLDTIIGLRKASVFSSDPLSDYISSKIRWLTQAPLILRDFLIEHQLKFDDDLIKAQEFDFFIKLLYVNSDYSFTDTPLVFLRDHANRISRRHSDDKYYVSEFTVAYNALRLVGHKINEDALYALHKRMLRQIQNTLQLQFYESSKYMMSCFLKIHISFFDKLVLYSAFCVAKFLPDRSYLSNKILSWYKFKIIKKRKKFRKWNL